MMTGGVPDRSEGFSVVTITTPPSWWWWFSAATNDRKQGRQSTDKSGGCGVLNSQQQSWCRSSTVTATVGGDVSFAASISCSDESDEDRGEQRWVRRREKVAVATRFFCGGKSPNDSSGWRPCCLVSLLLVTNERDRRQCVGGDKKQQQPSGDGDLLVKKKGKGSNKRRRKEVWVCLVDKIAVVQCSLAVFGDHRTAMTMEE
ncbi:unnamed protein product [Lactuca saligna]|uniref:Uncharacterized protein n=1 Tax=Lactuca saligna TaxID=75948 RepID=A0AA36EJN1_LACSI|nr:unnamed protein product [Lactuca saligna]